MAEMAPGIEDQRALFPLNHLLESIRAAEPKCGFDRWPVRIIEWPGPDRGLWTGRQRTMTDKRDAANHPQHRA